jgi:hypothetical protein
MTTYDSLDSQGQLRGFEVPNLMLGRRGLARVVRQLTGATLVRGPLRVASWFREEVFCEFDLGGVRFTVLEPFGDNSRYLIVADPPRPVPEIRLVRDMFRRAGPFGWFIRRAT